MDPSDDYEEDPRDSFRRVLGELRLVVPEHSAEYGPDILLAEVSVSLQTELKDFSGTFERAPHAGHREESKRLKLPSRFDAVGSMFKRGGIVRYDDFLRLDQKLIELFDGMREYSIAWSGNDSDAYASTMTSLAKVRRLTLDAQKRQAAETVLTWDRDMREAEGTSMSVLADANKALEGARNAYSEATRSRDELTAASVDLSSIQERWKDLDSKLETQEKRFKVVNKNKAEEVLTNHFKAFETGHANNFRWNLRVGIALIAFGAVFGIYQSVDFVNWQPRTDQSYPDVIWRIVIVSSVVGLGSYFLKQASTYRQLVVWAQAIGIQLLTFDAYTGLVDNAAQRSQLHAEFAKRIFGPEPTNGGNGSETAASAPVVIDTLPHLEALLKATKDQSRG